MHSILTCLLMDLVASYLSVYGSVQPVHSEAPVARSREFQIRLFVIHSSPPVIKYRTLRNVLCESLQTWIIILNEHNFTKHEFWHISCIHLVTNISGFFETNSLSMFIYDSIRHMQNDEKITLLTKTKWKINVCYVLFHCRCILVHLATMCANTICRGATYWIYLSLFSL